MTNPRDRSAEGRHGGPNAPAQQPEAHPDPALQPPQGQPSPVPESSTGKVVGIVAAAAMVLAGAGVGIAAALGAFSSDEGDPEAVFQAMLDAVDDGDGAKFMTVVCQDRRSPIEEQMDARGLTVDEIFPDVDGAPRLTAEVTDVSVSPDGDTATITFDGITDFGDGQTETDADITQNLVKEDGSWKVC